jgi:ParB family chromosome partitioning protein
MEIELINIVQNPNQVRDLSDDEELRELAESIKQHGLLQPIKVRPTDLGYELVYGHRRFAAMRLLGWTKCEAIVEGVTDEDSLAQSIVENLQRQNLDILEEARSYRILVERGYTLEGISKLVKKPEGRISNRLSILRLPSQIQVLVRSRTGQHATATEQGALSPDSASRIASAAERPDEAIALTRKALAENLSSREIRELTGLLKETPTHYEREQIIGAPWKVTSEAISQIRDGQTAKRSDTTQAESFNVLVHRKIVWNLQRLNLEQFDHFTIGYSERSLDQFIELLQLAHVELLADVRRVPISRFRPEFSKSNLSGALAKHGIKYAHWPELGVPTEIRESLQAEDLFAWYDSNIQPDLKLAKHDTELSSQRVAFMCVEVDPRSCHRHRIAVCLERTGHRLLDL